MKFTHYVLLWFSIYYIHSQITLQQMQAGQRKNKASYPAALLRGA